MALVQVRGVKRFRDRHGKWRVYHRKTGQPLKAEFGTAAFFLELNELDHRAAHSQPATGQKSQN
jgi:hypothetical protein